MIPALPDAFIRTPLTHRGLHDIARGRPENSRAGLNAAIRLGYGIEIDLQLSSDGEALVFHDYELSRLTGETGAIRQRSAAEAGRIALKHGDGETIPTLSQILELVQGRVPLLIELKDQDGDMGPGIGALEAATGRVLAGYRGDVAVMSFNPHSTMAMAKLAPDLPRGLVTCGFDPQEWPLAVATCERLRDIPDFAAASAAFVSHDRADLTRPRVARLRAQGVPVLCWTVRSPEEEAEARRYADNVTFEGYLAALPG